jgi:hypothetical protein
MGIASYVVQDLLRPRCGDVPLAVEIDDARVAELRS